MGGGEGLKIMVLLTIIHLKVQLASVFDTFVRMPGIPMLYFEM